MDRAESLNVTLEAHQTSIVSACAAPNPKENRHDRRNTAIRIQHNGRPGDVLALGYGRSSAAGSSSVVRFLDPGTWKSKSIAWSGVPIGETTSLSSGPFRTILVVANFSQKPRPISASLFTTSDDEVRELPLASWSLAPSSISEIEVPNHLGADLLQNSIVLTYDGIRGEISADVISLNAVSGQIVQNAAKDPNSGENAGGHPWIREENTDSSLILFNPDKAVHDILVKIPITSSKAWDKIYTLKAGETKNIDLAELVRDGVPDANGKRLPFDHQDEITWFTSQAGSGIGRLLQSNKRALLARNFSCGNYVVLCGNLLQNDFAGLVYGFTGYLGSSVAQFCTSYNPTTCGGQHYGGGSGMTTYSWTTSNSGVAALNGSQTTAKRILCWKVSRFGKRHRVGLRRQLHCRWDRKRGRELLHGHCHTEQM